MRTRQLIIQALAAVVLLLMLTLVASFAEDGSASDESEPSVDAKATTDAGVHTAALTDESSETASAEEPESAPSGPRFRSVGVLPVENQTRVMRGGKLMTQILFGRLGRKFGKVKFVRIDPAEDEGYLGGPILLTEAKRLGEKHQVDALIDGALLGFEIAGGIWPSRAVAYPEARVIVRLRVIRTSDGTVYKYYTHKPKKPKTYSPGIRTERELFGRVVRDAIDGLAKEMKKDGVFWEPQEKQ